MGVVPLGLLAALLLRFESGRIEPTTWTMSADPTVVVRTLNWIVIMGSLPDAVAGVFFLLFFLVTIGIISSILIAIWRGVRALENVADSLKLMSNTESD